MISGLASSKALLLVAAASCISNVVQFYRADAFQADIKARDTKIESQNNTILSYQNSVKQYNAEIDALMNERDDMVWLLAERAEQHNKMEQQLNDDINAVRKELEVQKQKDPGLAECLSRPWPDDIADRLRQDY